MSAALRRAAVGLAGVAVIAVTVFTAGSGDDADQAAVRTSTHAGESG